MENLEVFFVPLADQTSNTCFWDSDENGPMGEGWFYWFCLPGCLPDSDAYGPFGTEADAVQDAEDTFGD